MNTQVLCTSYLDSARDGNILQTLAVAKCTIFDLFKSLIHFNLFQVFAIIKRSFFYSTHVVCCISRVHVKKTSILVINPAHHLHTNILIYYCKINHTLTNHPHRRINLQMSNISWYITRRLSSISESNGSIIIITRT